MKTKNMLSYDPHDSNNRLVKKITITFVPLNAIAACYYSMSMVTAHLPIQKI